MSEPFKVRPHSPWIHLWREKGVVLCMYVSGTRQWDLRNNNIDFQFNNTFNFVRSGRKLFQRSFDGNVSRDQVL